MQTHILLLEDDSAQRLLLAAYVRQAGYEVMEAESMAQAYTLLQNYPTHLALLDLNLPDGDGLELAKVLRHRNIPTIIVTSRPGDRIEALELGIDDFLDKPYHPRELLARIQNVLRRYREVPSWTSRFGAFRLDRGRRKLLNADEAEVSLTPGEFNLLAALVAGSGRAVSRADLLEHVSPDGASVDGRSVDVLVSRLRHKLEANPSNPCLLLTVPGIGYRIQE